MENNMKYVLLSADSNPSVYLVPDIVADNLREYCMEFCDVWLRKSPYARKFRFGNGFCYNEKDFIEYLNTWLFPHEQSKLVWDNEEKDISPTYQGCEWFNF